MQLNKGLNLDGLPDTVETGDYRYAENVVLDSTYKLPTNENGLLDIEIILKDTCGIIPFDKGMIVFNKSNEVSNIKVIFTDSQNINKEYIKYNINIPTLNFTKEQPIRGTTSYNQRGDLICIFSCGVNGNWEDKIINFNSYETLDNYINPTYTFELDANDLYLLDINPNVQFPSVTNNSIAGSLITGSYQIAVTYKIDKEYTNYSLLSLPYYVYGHTAVGDGTQDGLSPNNISTEGIRYSFSNLDIKYKYFRIAVIYNDGTTFKVYTTPDIKINSTGSTTYEVQNLSILDLSTLNDTLIKSIFYSNSESLNIMNNRLYRANLRSQEIIGFDDIAQRLANNVLLDLNLYVITANDLINIKSKQFIKFQSDELYALYLTLGDNKGNIIGSYPINTNSYGNILTHPFNYIYQIPRENPNFGGSSIIYTTNTISVQLPILDDTNYPSSFRNKIGFWCIHRAQRTNSNSKIYAQGIIMPQIDIGYSFNGNDTVDIPDRPDAILYCNSTIPHSTFGSNPLEIGWGEAISGTFLHKTDVSKEVRFYSFEDLYNKNDAFPANKIDLISKYTFSLKPLTDVVTINNTLYITGEEKTNKTIDIDSQKLVEGNNLDIDNILTEGARILHSPLIDQIYISRVGTGISENDKLYRCNTLTPITEYYKYIYNEVLVLCTTINTLTNNTLIAVGDTFYSEFNIRLKRVTNTKYQPFYTFVNPVVIKGMKVSEAYDPTWILNHVVSINVKALVESKYNIHARYWEGKYPEYEQPINTVEQIGYNKVYNLQNTEDVTTIVDINNNEDRLVGNIFNTRIIKSTIANTESNQLGFRKYLALDYFDMPYNRGPIRSLYSTYKNMYIQQELSLAIASIKDIISYQDGATYVGTGELFDRQPQEIIPTGYGYVGCESYYNTGINDLGYWVIDSIQSQIFLITDNSIAILTDGKCKRWFKDKLHGVNPFKNQGSYITYDKQLKRFLLTVTNDDASKAFTISYVPEIKNWFSFHYYTPMYGIYTRNDTYYLIQTDTEIHSLFKYVDSLKSQLVSNNMITPIKRNTTDIQKMIISIYHNDYSSINKLYESLNWDTSFVIDNVDIYDKTFTSLNITNDSQSTGNINVNDNQEWFDATTGVYKNNIWFFNMIFDYVKDNKINIFNITPTDIYNAFDLNDDNINTALEWFEISRFISTFVAVTFIFDNWYYSTNGNFKGLTGHLNDSEGNNILGVQPTLSLKDIDFEYKRNNR